MPGAASESPEPITPADWGRKPGFSGRLRPRAACPSLSGCPLDRTPRSRNPEGRLQAGGPGRDCPRLSPTCLPPLSPPAPTQTRPGCGATAGMAEAEAAAPTEGRRPSRGTTDARSTHCLPLRLVSTWGLEVGAAGGRGSHRGKNAPDFRPEDGDWEPWHEEVPEGLQKETTWD